MGVAQDNARQSAFYAENDRTEPAGPDPFWVKLEIDNFYDGDKVRTVVHTTIEPPPVPLSRDHSTLTDKEMDDLTDWEEDEIFPHTGTGKEQGDSAYFVKVIETDDPKIIPLGTEFEFGT